MISRTFVLLAAAIGSATAFTAQPVARAPSTTRLSMVSLPGFWINVIEGAGARFEWAERTVSCLRTREYSDGWDVVCVFEVREGRGKFVDATRRKTMGDSNFLIDMYDQMDTTERAHSQQPL